MTDELAALIAKRFIQRRDIKAVQHRNGAYSPVESKFTMGDLRDHLSGKRSLGHYLLDENNQCKLFAYDIDLIKTADQNPIADERVPLTQTPEGMIPGSPRELFFEGDQQIREQLMMELRTVAEGIVARTARLLEIETAISFSGSKGLHVYAFTGTAPAKDVRDAAQDALLTSGIFEASRGNNFFRYTGPAEPGFPNIEIEIFPKQASLDGKQLGNLMRLPLGVNAKSGRESFFVDPLVPDTTTLPRMDAAIALEKGINWS